MIERIADLVVRRPWFFILGFIVVAVAFGVQIP